MPVTYVQGKATVSGGGATSVTITPDATFTSGNFVVVTSILTSEAVTFSISNAGTALSWYTLGPYDSGSQTQRGYIWYAQVTASDVTSVTLTRSGGTATISGVLGEFSGIGSGDPKDAGVNTGETSGATGHDIASGMTTAQADEVIIGAAGSTTGATFAAGAAMTLIGTAGVNGAVYRIASSTGTYTCPLGSVAAETCLVLGVTFKGVAAAAAGHPARKRFGGIEFAAINKGVW